MTLALTEPAIAAVRHARHLAVSRQTHVLDPSALLSGLAETGGVAGYLIDLAGGRPNAAPEHAAAGPTPTHARSAGDPPQDSAGRDQPHLKRASVETPGDGDAVTVETLTGEADDPATDAVVGRVFEHATAEAGRRSHRSIGTEHLLLGLIAEAERDPQNVPRLSEEGVDRERLREELESRLGAPRPEQIDSDELTHLFG